MAMPLHRTLMTLEEFVALPEDDSARYELQEGVLVVSPKPARGHQTAMLLLAMQIHQQCPRDWQVVVDFEVIVQADGPATVRAPDLVVIGYGGPDKRLAASEVVLAVEIISPGSRNVDLHLKPFEYAEAGIPHYWVVDLDPPAPSITVFGRGAPDDGYVESRTAGGELIVAEPFDLRIDVDALVDRRS